MFIILNIQLIHIEDDIGLLLIILDKKYDLRVFISLKYNTPICFYVFTDVKIMKQ